MSAFKWEDSYSLSNASEDKDPYQITMIKKVTSILLKKDRKDKKKIKAKGNRKTTMMDKNKTDLQQIFSIIPLISISATITTIIILKKFHHLYFTTHQVYQMEQMLTTTLFYHHCKNFNPKLNHSQFK